MRKLFSPALGAAMLLAWSAVLAAAQPGDSFKNHISPRVFEVPAVHPAPERDKPGVQAIFYEALPYHGKPTRVFAYLGLPQAAAGQNHKVPGMVLLHGGGGTAFAEWVRIWNGRGYAAIAMDLEGHVDDGTDGKAHPGHPFSGPARQGTFADTDQPLADQWGYHAVSDILLAHSLLAAQPGVDPARIGVTGISWGGILASLVSGVDPRFKCAIPVYGCGYLYDSKSAFSGMNALNAADLEKRKYWDPARYFASTTMPMLWVDGDRDPHFSIDVFSRSHETVKGPSTLCIHPAMHHAHKPGYLPNEVPEIYAFADSILKGGTPLARITHQPAGRDATLVFESTSPITRAEAWYRDAPLVYGHDAKNPHGPLVLKHPWHKAAASLNRETHTVSAWLPASTVMYYLNLIDARGCVVSSNVVNIEAK